ncbi:hypothetical protein MA16_Dca022033 [Dendrobium catenatum]|uniref:Uncharacterized protein n=1 Tax=Dendrobium catenatum TaxID=906689 RepID=A0A2I0WKL9_9ASPA|nr:hypothetical protein MA16_Dca022033 [Dendrobium catenatum]
MVLPTFFACRLRPFQPSSLNNNLSDIHRTTTTIVLNSVIRQQSLLPPPPANYGPFGPANRCEDSPSAVPCPNFIQLDHTDPASSIRIIPRPDQTDQSHFFFSRILHQDLHEALDSLFQISSQIVPFQDYVDQASEAMSPP